MKRLVLIPALILALLLPACSTPNAFTRAISAVTTPFTNPVSPNNIYQVKLAFNISLKLANKWADYCWSKPYAQLMTDPVASQVCKNRRQTRRTLFAAAARANAAIVSAQIFIKNNPTINPIGVIDDAWKAVTDYQSLVAQVAPAQ